MIKDTISVYDDAVLLEIPFSACVLYHGRDSIGGLSLGFRMLQWALKELCGERIPERKEISFKTAFPGPGLRDAVEMVTRAVTRKTYDVLDTFPTEAPEGVYGRMYFEVSVGEKQIYFYLKPGVIPEKFVLTGREIKKGSPSEIQKKEWRQLKDALSDAVWSIDDMSSVFVIVKK